MSGEWKQWNVPKPLAVVVIGTVVLGLGLMACPEGDRATTSHEPAPRPEPTRAERVKELHSKLLALPPTAPVADITAACSNFATLDGVPAESRPTCAKAYLASAQDAFRRKDYETANAMAVHAETNGADAAATARILKIAGPKIEAQRKKVTSEALIADRQLRAATREAMGVVIRDRFLNGGLDIKVRVSGKNSDRVNLTYVLFSDVWSHRFHKDGFIMELCNAGFRRVEMEDGYDWGVVFTCPK